MFFLNVHLSYTTIQHTSSSSFIICILVLNVNCTIYSNTCNYKILLQGFYSVVQFKVENIYRLRNFFHVMYSL